MSYTLQLNLIFEKYKTAVSGMQRLIYSEFKYSEYLRKMDLKGSRYNARHK